MMEAASGFVNLYHSALNISLLPPISRSCFLPTAH